MGLSLTVNYISEIAGLPFVLLYFLILFLKTFLVDPQFLLVPPPPWIQYPSVLLTPTTAMNIVFRIALLYDTYYPETGLTWSNINVPHERLSVSITLLMLVINMVVMASLLKYSGRDKDEDAA